MVDSESASLEGWDQIGLDLAHPGLSKFRGPKDANYEKVVDAIQRIVADEAADWELDNKLDGQILPPKHQKESIQQPSQDYGLNDSLTERFAKIKGKSTGRESPREETHVSTSTTSRSDGPAAGQNSTLPLDLVYHEPYRRVPTPSSGEFPPSSGTPREPPATKSLGHAVLGFFLGAMGDSWLRHRLGGTLPTGECYPQALLGEQTPGDRVSLEFSDLTAGIGAWTSSPTPALEHGVSSGGNMIHELNGVGDSGNSGQGPTEGSGPSEDADQQRQHINPCEIPSSK